MNIFENPATAKVLFCTICNVSITYKGRGRVPKTCSSKCKNKLDHQSNPKKPKRETVCTFCSTKFFTAFNKQRFCSNECRLNFFRASNDLQSKVYFYSCCDCQIIFAKRKQLAGVAILNGIYCKECSKERERTRNRRGTLRRQGALSNPRISLISIAKRDNFICYLCEEPVDMGIPRTHKSGATIDHIKPLSKGGFDTIENVSLAHWICNIKKSDKYDA